MAKIPFDIKFRPQIESGEYKVVNSYGEPVRIICWDARIDFPNGIRPIISLQLIDGKYEVVSDHLKNGKIYSFKDAPADLFIVTPDEEPRKFKIKVSEFAEAYNLAATDFNSEEYKACDGNLQLIIDKYATALLDLAREQFIKDGYIIEKKAFHDAVEKVPPEVMKEVSDNVDKENELAKKHLEGYINGREDTLREMKDFIESHFNTKKVIDGKDLTDFYPKEYTQPLYVINEGVCTNPTKDCINCPRMTAMEMYNTTCGISTGNTSATDGKEHNSSFTD